MNGHPSTLAVITFVLVIVVIFALVVLYIIYFLDRDITDEFGTEWEYRSISDTATKVRPQGNQILSINGGSTSRGTNPDFIYISKPKNVPYTHRLFIIYNNSETTQLQIRTDGVNQGCSSGGDQFFITALTGTVFVWKSKDTIIPIVIGTTANV